MHKATPLNSSFRAYVAGGCRSTVSSVDDSKGMQEMSGGFMHNESRSAVESPQNYGFTSVTMDGTKGADGSMGSDCPETFTSFMGGNRSFPVNGPIDDRRHRLNNLDKGDVAMFRTKSDYQQFHMSQDGGFWSAPRDKTVRMALLDKDSQQQQQGGQGGSAGTLDASGGSSGGSSGSSSGGAKKGQQSVKKDNQDSKRFVDITKDETRVSGDKARLYTQGSCYLSVHGSSCYVGGNGSDGAYAPLVTTQGPTTHSPGRYG